VILVKNSRYANHLQVRIALKNKRTVK